MTEIFSGIFPKKSIFRGIVKKKFPENFGNLGILFIFL